MDRLRQTASNAPADGVVSASEYQQEKLMKRMCLAALTGALAISTMAVAIDVASAATRGGVYRGGVNRVGVGHVGVGRVGVGRAGIGYGRAGIGYGRAALAYRGGWNGYYGRGLGVAAGVALGTAAAGAYYDDSSYASIGYTLNGAYILNGAYMSESDAVAYCAQHFRSYDVESRTFLAYSGQRESCPQ
jgi:BA14K-like protein